MKNIFIISGPSGVGEDSVINGLKKKIPIKVITTTTSRKKRAGESQANPYYFISKKKFKEKIKKGDFLEWVVEDNDNYYGTYKTEFIDLKNNKVIIWKIDYQGVIMAKKRWPKDVVTILLTAPLDVLKKRIAKRGQQNTEFIKNRLKYAEGWEKNKKYFDYIISNTQGKLANTIEKITNIINAEFKKQNS